MEYLDLRKFFYDNLKSKEVFFYYRDKYRTWKWTFNDILDSALKFSVLLENLKLKKGDRVLLKAPARPEWVFVYIGCAMYGAIIVPLDFKSDKKFIEMVAGDTEPKLYINSKDSENNEDIKNLKGTQLFLEDLEDKIRNNSLFGYEDVTINQDDILEIVYTSGTTAKPKGVILSYKNISSNLSMAMPIIKKWKKFLNYIPRSKILTIIPLSHMYGQVVGIFIPIVMKISVIFIHSIMPRDILETIKKEHPVSLGALPQQLQIIKEYILVAFGLKNEKFHAIFNKYKKKKWWIRFIRFQMLHFRIGFSLLSIISGGAKISNEVDEFYRTISYGFFQGYGLTETAPLLSLYDPSKNKAGSVGSFLDSDNIMIKDGELYVKGDNVTSGYYNNPEKTQAAFEKGWFKTGDLVEVDKEGNVFVKGRRDDLIVKESGIKVYASDIEEVFKKQSDVKDVSVFGLERNGKIEIIAVILPENIETDESQFEEIVRMANSELNVNQHVNDFLIWEGDDFPRTSVLKVKKRQILETIEKSKNEKESLIARTALKEYEKQRDNIFDLIEKIKKPRGSSVNREASLEKDLGFDSLDIISFSTELEDRYGIDASVLDLTSQTKIKDIEEKIKNPPKRKNILPFFKFSYNYFFIFIRTFFQYLIFPFVRMLYRTWIDGRQNLQDIDRPTAFISNHVSLMDSLVILYSLPLKSRMKLAVVMSIGHHFTNFFARRGNIFRRIVEGAGFYLLVSLFINVIPLSRVFGFEQVFKNVGKAIDMGWDILVFPEGAITPDGKIHEFESGIGIITKDMKVPVVPIRIDGLYGILRNGILPFGHLPMIPMITVKIGKQAYYKEGLYAEISKKLYRIIAQKLE
ncbi:MAG: AMP-binding protein [Candidatus Humimicrobiaceae bacterium]